MSQSAGPYLIINGGKEPMQPDTPMTLDQRLQTAVIHHPHLKSSTIHFRTRNGNVKIEGTAKTFYEKQMAQELLKKVTGVTKVENNLTVAPA